MNYISLGYFCSIAIELEKLGLRKEASPFDWLISDFEGVMACIQNHFSGFLEYDNLAQNQTKHAYYKNIKYNIQFFHDFNKYDSLKKQLPDVQEKYNRRIERFYNSITDPTLFIRYISDEQKQNGISKELLWIEDNYDSIITVLKSFNEHNDILFIANDGVVSAKITIYNVPKDSNDLVARSPISTHPVLSEKFSNVSLPDKEKNITRYIQKLKKQNSSRLRKRILSRLKKLFFKEYIHTHQYP